MIFVNPLEVSRTIGVNSQDSISTGRPAMLAYVDPGAVASSSLAEASSSGPGSRPSVGSTFDVMVVSYWSQVAADLAGIGP